MSGQGPQGTTLEVHNHLQAPHRAAGDKLHLVVGAYLARRRDVTPPESSLTRLAPWGAEHFGLHRVTVFQAAPKDVQEAILRGCAQNLFEEAYAIEKTGMCYCAKLSLLSETAEERMTYSMMAADEATHFGWVAPLVEQPAAAGEGPFVRLLSDTVEQGTKNVLTLLMQVLLEGWGLTHYRKLAEGCRVAPLRDVFRSILVDEALHHGSGKHLFQPQALGENDVRFAHAFLGSMFRMVQVGPQGVASQVERHLGGLSPSERETLFEELQCQATSEERLQLLCGLLAANGAQPFVTWLEANELLRPLSARLCAQTLEQVLSAPS